MVQYTFGDLLMKNNTACVVFTAESCTVNPDTARSCRVCRLQRAVWCVLSRVKSENIINQRTDPSNAIDGKFYSCILLESATLSLLVSGRLLAPHAPLCTTCLMCSLCNPSPCMACILDPARAMYWRFFTQKAPARMLICHTRCLCIHSQLASEMHPHPRKHPHL